jgi:hypothetical protein
VSGVVVVQQILTSWSKKSRGGEGAVKRNAIPEVAPVPMHCIKTERLTLLHQSLSYSEWDGFAPREKIEVNPTLRPVVIGGVTVNDDDEVAVASFQYNLGCGAPERGWARKTLRIAEGEWGQILYNGRFAPPWEGPWWYEKMVVNIGLFSHLSSGVFTHCAPTCRFSAMGHLF